MAALLAVAWLASSAAAGSCAGDCDGDGRVVVGELVTAVSITLGAASVAQCPPADVDENGGIDIAELIAAVAVALEETRCAPTPTASATRHSSATPTASPLPVAEQRINVHTAGNQSDPDVALHPDGGFVVVWSGDGAPNGPAAVQGIFARRFDAAGAPLGGEIQVSSGAGEHQRPRIAALEDGRFAVVWQILIAGRTNVYAHLLDAAALPQGESVRVSRAFRLRHDSPAITATVGGGFAVVWQSDDSADVRRDDVYLKRFDRLAAALADESRVNDANDQWDHAPTMALGAGGRLLVAWARSTYASSARGIFARWLDADGASLGNQFPIDERNTALNDDLAVLTRGGDAFVAAWSRRDHDQSHPLLIGSIDGATIPLSDSGDDDQAGAALAADGLGHFVVAWQSFGRDGDRWGVYARRVTIDPPALGTEFRVHDYTASSQINPRIAVDPAGQLIVVWQSFGQDGSGYGVYGRVFPAI